ncbi:MAG: hypothetical protein DMG74_18060 [Acidobacteria bacterium]|nr:MAG: hypothetical protein DMG74_18060 [Acidobacteriota bacterium]
MKHAHVLVLALAVAVYCVPAFAQHGHITHSRINNGSSSSSTHQRTMDQQLSKNTRLSSKIQTLTGIDAPKACDGFKNLGQCVAAAHVSKNLGISFDCQANSKKETKKGTQQADQDLRDSSNS